MEIIIWMTAVLGLLAVELSSKAFTTLWFAGGAAAGAAAAWAGVALSGQLGWFVAVSFLILFLVRPLALLLASAAPRGTKAGKRRSPSPGGVQLSRGGGKNHGLTTGFE